MGLAGRSLSPPFFSLAQQPDLADYVVLGNQQRQRRPDSSDRVAAHQGSHPEGEITMSGIQEHHSNLPGAPRALIRQYYGKGLREDGRWSRKGVI